LGDQKENKHIFEGPKRYSRVIYIIIKFFGSVFGFKTGPAKLFLFHNVLFLWFM